MTRRNSRPDAGKLARGVFLALSLLGGLCSPVIPAAETEEVLPTGETTRLFAEPRRDASPVWDVKSLSVGGTFRPVVYFSTFRTTIQTTHGPMLFADQPWAKQAIVRIRVDELNDPAARDLLQKRTNPIMIFGEGAFVESFMYPGNSAARIDQYFESVVKAKEAFGDRFLCFDYGEWTWGGVSGTEPMRELPLSCETLRLPLPKTATEATDWFRQRYNMVFRRYHDAGIPIFSWNASSLNHHEARLGTALTGNEIAYINPAMDSTYLAFCRGASRQFNLPWGSYAAGYGGLFGHSSFLVRSPDERVPLHGHPAGPYSAASLDEQRRTLYAVYMAGGNLIIKENDHSQGMLSNYNPETVERTHPRIIALQPKSYPHAGPYARLVAELYDSVVQKRDRGTPYTPIALLCDADHGFVFKYSQTLALGALPYTPAEEHIRGAVNTIFPWEASPRSVGPFGEIFDVITTAAAPAVINSYRAIVLIGRPNIDASLADILRTWVAQGGVIFLACEQITPAMQPLTGISDTGEIGQDTTWLRASDFSVYQQGPYQYHKVHLKGAKPLFVVGQFENRSWPAATIHQVGHGSVIVGTPVWLHVAGDPTRMHGLFSEVLSMMAAELNPFNIHGDEVRLMYNRSRNGWVVTIMNPRGTTIAWPGYKPAVQGRDAAGVVLEPRFAFSAVSEWTTGVSVAAAQDGLVSVVVPPGDIRIIEFQTESP